MCGEDFWHCTGMTSKQLDEMVDGLKINMCDNRGHVMGLELDMKCTHHRNKEYSDDLFQQIGLK